MKKHIIKEHLINGLHKVNIALIGAGGNGSQMLSHLARMDDNLRALGHKGFHVTLWDADLVEAHNVGRQNFSTFDVGEHKSIVLVERINRFYGLNWDAKPEYYNGEGLGFSDVVITAVDNVSARRMVQKTRGSNSYWLDMGNGEDRGQVVLGGNGLPHIFDLHPNMEDDEEPDTPSCSHVESLAKQDLMVNTIVSAYASQLLWTLFKTTQLQYHGLYINLQTLKTTPIKVR